MTATGQLRTDAPSRAEVEQIKTVSVATGVRVAREVLELLGGGDALTIHEYATTGGITLELPEGVLVNAPFDDPFCEASPLILRLEDGLMVLRLGELSVPVERVVPLPGYLDAVDAGGRAVTDTVMSHADRIRVSPIGGCAFDCRFCDLATLRYRPRPVEQLVAAIDVALEDEALPPRHLLISGGSPGRTPAQRKYFEDSCVAIAQHVRSRRGTEFEVDIMMTPFDGGPEFVDRVVDAGVTGFSFNVEVYSDPYASEHLPLKRKLAREHFEPMIARAVEVLGSERGDVRSLIIPGLEPPEGTLAGVEWLASMGCHPVLSPFRPARDTKLADAAPVSPEYLTTVLTEARAIVARHGVRLGPRCVPCQHNTLTFPWDVAPAEDREQLGA